jgi:hypothetical protein
MKAAPRSPSHGRRRGLAGYGKPNTITIFCSSEFGSVAVAACTDQSDVGSRAVWPLSQGGNASFKTSAAKLRDERLNARHIHLINHPTAGYGDVPRHFVPHVAAHIRRMETYTEPDSGPRFRLSYKNQ